MRAGGAIALASMARVRSPVLPDTKTIFEILPNLNADQQWLIDFRQPISTISGGFLLPLSLCRQNASLSCAKHQTQPDKIRN